MHQRSWDMRYKSPFAALSRRDGDFHTHGSLGGVFGFAYTSSKGKKGAGKFTYLGSPTLSGEFISLKTKANEDSSGAYKISASGALLADTTVVRLTVWKSTRPFVL